MCVMCNDEYKIFTFPEAGQLNCKDLISYLNILITVNCIF